MITNKIRPLRIFISSTMYDAKKPERNKIVDIRLSLNKRLEAYSFLEPYILEDNGPSSLDLESTYIAPLLQSNLILFILDSKFPIPSGVQKEIDTARAEEIPRIFFIIPGNNGEEEVAKNQLFHQHESGYISPLPKSDDYVTDIENTIFKQLVTVFQLFSQKHGAFSRQFDSDSEAKNLNTSLLSSGQFNKTIFNHVGLTKQTIRNMIFHDESDSSIEAPESALDENTCALILRILQNRTLPHFWSQNMLASIQEAVSVESLSDEFSKILELRLKATQLFFEEKFDDASDCLKDALRSAKTNDVPQWIIQDILIDLRNLLSIDEEQNNQWVPENLYQQQLNEFKNQFYYPGIDRSLNTVHSWVRKEVNASNTSSSNEERAYGPGINMYPDAITDAEIYAICNGSIAQIRQLPDNMNIISEMFMKRFEDRLYFKDVIKNMLLMGNSYKKINRWLNRYSFILGQFTDTDALELLNAVDAYPIQNERLAIRCTTIRIVSDFMSDEQFKKYWSKLFNDVLTWLNGSPFVLHPVTEILGLFRYCFRIPQEHVVLFVSKIDTIGSRYNSEIANIIRGAIDFKKTSEENRKTISKVMLHIIKSVPKTSFTKEIKEALIMIISYWPNESRDISDFLKESEDEYWKENIQPSLWKNADEPNYKLFVESQLHLMKNQNKQQTGRVISTFGVDPFATIYSLIAHGNIIKASDITQISNEIIATMNNPYQTIDVKQSALKLTMLMIQKKMFSAAQFTKQISSENFTAETSNFFEAFTPTEFIEVIRMFINLLKDSDGLDQLLTMLTLDQSPRYLAFITSLLIDFIPITLLTPSQSNSIPLILQFLITNSDSHQRENALIIDISACLVKLATAPKYSQIALGQLQRLASDTNMVVQRHLIDQIHNVPANMQKGFLPVKSQLLLNSNYSVQQFAKLRFE